MKKNMDVEETRVYMFCLIDNRCKIITVIFIISESLFSVKFDLKK